MKSLTVAAAILFLGANATFFNHYNDYGMPGVAEAIENSHGKIYSFAYSLS